MRGSATPEEKLRLYGGMGRAYELSRRWGEAKTAYERMLATARKAQDQEAEWQVLVRLTGLGTDMTTDPETDDETFRGVKEKAEQEEGAAAERGRAGSAGESGLYEWSPEYARTRAEEALTMAREMGRNDLVAHSITASCSAEILAGRWAQAAEKALEARTLYAAMGERAMEAESLNASAWGAVLTGALDKALRVGRERRALARELGGTDIHLADLHGLTLALLEVGNYEEALARRELGRFAEAAGQNLRPRLAYLHARSILERWGGATGSAIGSLREAETSAEEIGLPGELWQIRVSLGEIHEERGENEEANRCFDPAVEGVRDLAEKIDDTGLREGFLTAPQVRRVLERAE